MKTPMTLSILCLLALISSVSSLADTLKSPDGHLAVNFNIGQSGPMLGLPTYQVSVDGEVLINPSLMGVTLQGSGPFAGMTITGSNHVSGDETYTMPVGKVSFVSDRYEEYSYQLQETVTQAPVVAGSTATPTSLLPARILQITFRVFNDGFAFRYSFPKQAAFSDFVITDELTSIALAQNPITYGLPLGFSSSYEWFYRVQTMDKWAVWDNLALPLLLQYPDGKMVGITEADLTDYAGMYLEKSPTDPNTLETRLAPWLGQTDIKVKATAPFASPWRVFMVGNSAKPLLESNILEDLNEPSVIADTSWIHPGKVQFPWWNGYVVPNVPTGQVAGVNTWTIEHYIDFCAANGIENHSIDGFDQAWYGGPVDPFQAADVTTAIPALNMPEVLSYAKARGVGTRLWMNWGGISKNIEQSLATYEQWGVEGIMVDFLNRDDQEMVRSYHQILQGAANHHLTVTFHGVFKPTGQGRTYPNLLTHEAVLGTEYNKWSDIGSTPEHEVQVAYVRMLAGPLDVHEGSFRPVAVKDYQFSWILPKTMGTLARQLAMYVVYENHEPMLADYPEIYTQNPVPFQFVKEVPVSWDETHMVAGDVGKYITMARRKGNDWYLGTITDRDPRNFSLPLTFLGAGNYMADIYSDSSDFDQHPESVVLQSIPVTSASSLALVLAPAGGNAIRIRKLP
jgi:alpha-glucosidase